MVFRRDIKKFGILVLKVHIQPEFSGYNIIQIALLNVVQKYNYLKEFKFFFKTMMKFKDDNNLT